MMGEFGYVLESLLYVLIKSRSRMDKKLALQAPVSKTVSRPYILQSGLVPLMIWIIFVNNLKYVNQK